LYQNALQSVKTKLIELNGVFSFLELVPVWEQRWVLDGAGITGVWWVSGGLKYKAGVNQAAVCFILLYPAWIAKVFHFFLFFPEKPPPKGLFSVKKKTRSFRG